MKISAGSCKFKNENIATSPKNTAMTNSPVIRSLSTGKIFDPKGDIIAPTTLAKAKRYTPIF
jgi:hypothetical protein